ncbi:MAG: AI-2E family transporter [Parachlamydiaceae bacterium]|nr:AI-2E family transporter [Parachlamydiaceae bacterium]
MLKILPFFTSFFGLISNLIFSVIIAQVIYYAARPLRQFLEERKVPRIVSIMLIFIILSIAIALIFMFIWPFLSQQITEFTETPKEKIADVESKTMDILNAFNFTSLDETELKENMIFYIREAMMYIVKNISVTISSLANIASYFIVTPFLLFYLLKEDYGMFSDVIDHIPGHKKKVVRKIFNNIDDTLGLYINGQILVSCVVSGLIFAGYSLIGLNYAFVIGLLTFFFNLIPFCGTIISTIPALLIGFSDNPLMAFKVLAVVIIVHLLDMNLISPRVVGYSLNIHPITMILLLVLGFSLGGIIGLFVITPLYAVLKSITGDIIEFRESKETKEVAVNE